MIPIDSYKKTFQAEQQKIYTAPQRHVEATEKYVEAIFDGEEDTSNGIKPRAPKKYYQTKPSTKIIIIKKFHSGKRRYNKPLFVRDKKNPKILKPYRTKRHK